MNLAHHIVDKLYARRRRLTGRGNCSSNLECGFREPRAIVCRLGEREWEEKEKYGTEHPRDHLCYEFLRNLSKPISDQWAGMSTMSSGGRQGKWARRGRK